MINSAFIFPDEVTQSYSTLREKFYQNDAHCNPLLNKTESNNLDFYQTDIVNAYGLDLSNALPTKLDLYQAQNLLLHSSKLRAIRNLYLSSNRHNGLHWFLDSPYRYYNGSIGVESALDSDPIARNLFDTLQRDGFVAIDDFGGDIDSIIQTAEASVSQEALNTKKNESTIAGGGAVVTSRLSIPQVDDILAYNSTITEVVNAYQGPSILHGYKVTRLTKTLQKNDQYIAGFYHHDRVGRRLKAFIFLHDVDCDKGHPTLVATGTHKILYYRSEDYSSTRFKDDYVDKIFQIAKGCGKKGGGFLFDTNTIHKGSVNGDSERTVIIAEYHHIAKCAYSEAKELGIPCPGGDLYRIDVPIYNFESNEELENSIPR